MYCNVCGKEIPKQSTFCLHCGNKIDSPKSTRANQEQIEWEYKDFVYEWSRTKLPRGKFGIALGSIQIKRFFWDWHQREILEAFHKWLDDGWEPLSEIGPSSLKIIDHKPNWLLNQIWPQLKRRAELVEARVSMKRKQR